MPLFEEIYKFLTFFFAGTDTTGSTTGMAFFLLSRNPDAYEKLMKELNFFAPDPSKITPDILK